LGWSLKAFAVEGRAESVTQINAGKVILLNLAAAMKGAAG